MLRVRTILVVFLVLGLHTPLSYGQRYDGYFNGVTGSSRIVGLGGAYRAVADGIEAGIFNAGGISRQEKWFDGTFNYGTLQYSIDNVIDNLDSDSRTIEYVQLGATFRVGKRKRFGFGLLISSPSAFSLSGTALNDNDELRPYQFDFSRVDLAIPFSFAILSNLQVGVRLTATSAEMVFESQGGRIQDETIGAELDLGVQYQPNDQWYTGLTYNPGRTLSFENPNVSTLSDFSPFIETVIPHKVFLAAGYQPSPRWLMTTDLGFVGGLDDAFFPGSRLSSGSTGVESGQNPSFQYHMGLEWIAQPNRWELRVGHYFQPPRASGDIHRFHITGGVDYYVWYIKIGTAFDVAQGYTNIILSLTPSLSARKKREKTAKQAMATL